MAKVKFSALVSDMRNKLNGSVFSKNRAGSYLRNKVTPVNPQSIAQIGVRNTFTTLSQNWRGLTEAQRLSWASQVQGYQKTDIFGDLKTPSALQLYMRLNGNLAAIGVAPIAVAPVPGDSPSIDELTVAGDVSSTTLTLTTELAEVPDDQAYIVDATPGVSAGKNFVKSEYRQIKVLNVGDVIPANVWTEYVAKFGAPAAGQKIFVRLTPVNIVTGLRGLAIAANCIVIA